MRVLSGIGITIPGCRDIFSLEDEWLKYLMNGEWRIFEMFARLSWGSFKFNF